jgi:hypothetical protein
MRMIIKEFSLFSNRRYMLGGRCARYLAGVANGHRYYQNAMVNEQPDSQATFGNAPSTL